MFQWRSCTASLRSCRSIPRRAETTLCQAQTESVYFTWHNPKDTAPRALWVPHVQLFARVLKCNVVICLVHNTGAKTLIQNDDKFRPILDHVFGKHLHGVWVRDDFLKWTLLKLCTSTRFSICIALKHFIGYQRDNFIGGINARWYIPPKFQLYVYPLAVHVVHWPPVSASFFSAFLADLQFFLSLK